MATPLPPTSNLTGADTDEAEAKVWFSSLRTFLADLLGTSGDAVDARKKLRVPGCEMQTKTANYTVVAADCGRTLLFTGTDASAATLGLADTLGNGFTVELINGTPDPLTIDTTGTDLIDGDEEYVLSVGNSLAIRCDGVNFYVTARAGGGVESFNTRQGLVTLISTDVTGALGFTPSPNTHNHDGSYVRLDHSGMAVGALAFGFRTVGSGGLGKNTAYAGGQLGISEGGTWRAGYGIVTINTTVYAVVQRIA